MWLAHPAGRRFGAATLLIAAWLAGPGLAQPPAVAPPTELPGPRPAAAEVPPTPDAGGDALLFLPPPPKSKTQLEASWDNGLWFASADGQFRLHVGGNAQVDSTWLIGPQSVFALPGGGSNGVGNAAATFLRRVRPRFEGDLFDQFDYILEVDLANADNDNSGLQPPSFGNLNGSPSPKNVWLQVREVPYLGNVRFGNQVKPIGLTNNVYQGFLPFMERPDNMDAFYGPFDSGFSLGLSARNWSESERLTWQYGVYGPAINVFGISLNKYVAGGRVTALPWYDDDGRRLVHVGFGTYDGELEQNVLRVRARTELRNGPGYAVPILVDTGDVPGHLRYVIAPEFAMVLGSFTLQ